MTELNFSGELEKYIDAYNQIGGHEWIFFLKDFPVNKIRIKSILFGESKHKIYKGIADIELRNPQNNNFGCPSDSSNDPLECVLYTLSKILTTAEITDSRINRDFHKY